MRSAAAAHPVAGFAQEIILLGGEIRHDEAAQREALAQHRGHVGPGHRHSGVVLRDQPAHRDAGEIVEQWPHRLPDRAAHILEVLELVEKKAKAEDIRCKAIVGGVALPEISRSTYGEKEG